MAGTLDMVISTVNVTMEWENIIGTLRPRGRLHLLGAVLEPIPVASFQIMLNQLTVSGTPVGSPQTIATMFDFAQRHGIKPTCEFFKFEQINEALEHLESGKAHYRIVLKH